MTNRDMLVAAGLFDSKDSRDPSSDLEAAKTVLERLAQLIPDAQITQHGTQQLGFGPSDGGPLVVLEISAKGSKGSANGRNPAKVITEAVVDMIECTECFGRGRVACQECNGKGKRFFIKCKACDALGYMQCVDCASTGVKTSFRRQ